MQMIGILHCLVAHQHWMVKFVEMLREPKRTLFRFGGNFHSYRPKYCSKDQMNHTVRSDERICYSHSEQSVQSQLYADHCLLEHQGQQDLHARSKRVDTLLRH